MIITLEPDIPTIRTEYLRGLNDTFSEWGRDEAFRWYFERDAGDGAADLFTVRLEGALCAGSALVWRRLAFADGTTSRVGIMAGSWTRPTARGRGIFSRMIEESRERCSERGADLLLAFVTHDNASRRRLEAAGSYLIPSSYGKVEVASSKSEVSLRPVEISDEALFEDFHVSRAGYSQFAYESYSAWRGQYLDRLFPVHVITTSGSTVILESRPEYILVLAVLSKAEQSTRAALETLERWDGRAGRSILYYSTRDEALPSRWEAIPGFITTLPTGDSMPPSNRDWSVENGDRV